MRTDIHTDLVSTLFPGATLSLSQSLQVPRPQVSFWHLGVFQWTPITHIPLPAGIYCSCWCFFSSSRSDPLGVIFICLLTCFYTFALSSLACSSICICYILWLLCELDTISLFPIKQFWTSPALPFSNFPQGTCFHGVRLLWTWAT